MRALDRKLLRDLARLKGQVLTIALVVACGIAAFVSMVTTYDSLQVSRDTYYEQTRFAHVFASLKRAPKALTRTIEDIPGVTAVEARVVVEVTIDLPGVADPITGRMISLPNGRPPSLDRLTLRSGRFPEPERGDEALVSEAFAIANRLVPGQDLHAVVNGRSQRFVVTGIALSPEYVYAVRPGDFMPDDRRFGILWLPEPALAAAYDMTGAFNDLVVHLSPTASDRPVIARLDAVLAPYGGLGAYGRADQISNRFVSQELEQLRTWATAAPTIFLAVAAFLLNIVLSRLIGTQREQIAAIKAFGYGRAAIALHYAKLMSVILVLGALLGALFGAWAGRWFMVIYAEYFRFPVLAYRMAPWTIAASVAVTMVAGAIGGLFAVRRAVSLSPAEAMQPPAPGRYRVALIERLGLRALFSQQARMILRGMERRPLRSLLAVVGIALAVSVVLTGRFLFDSLDELIDLQFARVQREDAAVVFGRPLSPRAVSELAHVPGVLRVEGFRAVPVEIRAGHRARRLAVFGLPADATLRRLVDVNGTVHPLPPRGLVLTDRLGELLGLRVGDRVRLEVLEGNRAVREVEVADLVAETVGLNAYMRLDALHELLGEDQARSGALVSLDAGQKAAFHAALKQRPAVAGVTLRESVLKTFEELSGRSMSVTSVVLTVFASIIAVGVVYNTARILLAERERELASLRVLGFTRGEISVLLLGELGIEVVAGIPIGFFVGFLFTRLIVSSAGYEAYRLPVPVQASTLAVSALVVLGASVVSGLVVRRKLQRLDLVAVLKTRE